MEDDLLVHCKIGGRLRKDGAAQKGIFLFFVRFFLLIFCCFEVRNLDRSRKVHFIFFFFLLLQRSSDLLCFISLPRCDVKVFLLFAIFFLFIYFLNFSDILEEAFALFKTFFHKKSIIFFSISKLLRSMLKLPFCKALLKSFYECETSCSFFQVINRITI